MMSGFYAGPRLGDRFSMHNRNDPSAPGGPRRTEPVLGNLDQIDTGSDPRDFVRPARTETFERKPPFTARHQQAPRQYRRVPWWAIVIVLALAGGGGWALTHQSTLSALLPQTQLNSLLTRADAAFAAGKLSGDPDSARDLYEAARALDPDNERALTGLQNVGNAELKQAQAALQQQDYPAARTALEEARSLLGGGAAVAAVDQSLAKAVLRSANVDVLVNQARAALANGHIDGADGAAALFRKVLAGDPHNAVAQHGMDGVGNVLAARIQTALGNQDRAGARQTLTRLAGLLPGYSQLPSLRASVAAADRAADAQRDQYLEQGDADLRAGKVTGAGNDNAEAQFKAALAVDPGNAKAQAGLGRVAEALIVQANAALDAGHAQAAGKLLDQAAMLAPKSADLAAARSRLRAGGATNTTATATAATTLTPAESAKLGRLVAQAKVAADKGDIMLPPGNSAYDLYRAALGIDGNNAAAQAGLRALPSMTQHGFQRDLRRDNLDGAHDMLATLQQLNPGDPSIATMQHALGVAWLDRAEHYVGLGDAAAAQAALREAQRLVPGDPRISEVGAKLHRNG
jgi:tetratricopeptide (TPR) repeat protein